MPNVSTKKKHLAAALAAGITIGLGVGGTSVAAADVADRLTANDVRSKHIKNGTIKLRDLDPATVDSLDNREELDVLTKRLDELEDRIEALEPDTKPGG